MKCQDVALRSFGAGNYQNSSVTPDRVTEDHMVFASCVRLRFTITGHGKPPDQSKFESLPGHNRGDSFWINSLSLQKDLKICQDRCLRELLCTLITGGLSLEPTHSMNNRIKTIALTSIAALSLTGQTLADLLLSPADQIIGGILTDTEFVEGIVSTAGGGNNWPGAEPPEDLIDGFFGGGGAKYLNFFELNTGVIITPVSGATVVNSMTFWTANDSEPRDPASYELYGTNTVIVKGGPGTIYTKSDFTLISEGSLELPAERGAIETPIGDTPFSTGPLQTVDFANTESYTSYMLIFPTVKDAVSANSMQLSEVAFENVVNTSADIKITEIDYDKASDMVTVTWLSQPGVDYTLYYSPDLIDWDLDVEDSIPAEVDSETTTWGPFPNPIEGGLSGFFRVARN